MLLKCKEYRKVMPRTKYVKTTCAEVIEISKKLKKRVIKITENDNQNQRYKTIRLMFQDEAGFGRINKPRYC